MKKKTDKEKLRLAEREFGKKNARDWFLQFTRWSRPWMKELTEAYKSRGVFEETPVSVLTSYYANVEDKEIAAFLSLLIERKKWTENVVEFRQTIGEHPFEWFSERLFVTLGTGSNYDLTIGDIPAWEVARFLDRLHSITYPFWRVCSQSTSGVKWLRMAVDTLSAERKMSWLEVIAYLCESVNIDIPEWKQREMLLWLSLKDWNVEEKELKCPITPRVKRLLQTWWPDYWRYGSEDEAIEVFGLEHHYDFYYMAEAWDLLRKLRPSECLLFNRRYTSRWKKCLPMNKYYWISTYRILPHIKFEKETLSH